MLDEIADHGLVTLRSEGSGDTIWPASASQVVYAHSNTMTAAALEGAARMLNPFVHFVKQVKPLVPAAGVAAKFT